MQMQKLGKTNSRTFQGFYSILAKFKDFQGLENEVICFKDFQGCGNPEWLTNMPDKVKSVRYSTA